MKLSDALNTPREIKIGRSTVLVSRPSLNALAQWEEWLKEKIRTEARDFAAILPADGRTPVLQEAMRMIAGASFGSPIGRDAMSTARGLGKLISLCVSKVGGGTLSVDELLADLDDDTAKQVAIAMGLATDEEGTAGADPTTATATS